MSKIELVLQHFIENLPDTEIKDRYANLYKDYTESFTKVFAYFHQELNSLLEFLNIKNAGNWHYNAHESRKLLAIINGIDDLNRDLIGYGEEIVIFNDYQKILNEIGPFLNTSGGSPIPENLPKIHIIHHEPVFSVSSKKILITPTNQHQDLQIIGEWAFSKVSKYKDPSYDKYFAVKKLKKNSSDREIERFKKEFEILRQLNFPYILEVYSFDTEKNSYIMECCDTTLYKYIEKNNTRLPFATRKRISLQFLYAMNYLNSKEILHRDISYNNVLIKEFEGAVMIKLSDFWLMKEPGSDFTKVDTEIKWTIIDPSLISFKDYALHNEIYSIGFIVHFIFTGKKSFQSSKTSLSKIIEKCTSQNLESRYRSIGEIINIVEILPQE